MEGAIVIREADEAVHFEGVLGVLISSGSLRRRRYLQLATYSTGLILKWSDILIYGKVLDATNFRFQYFTFVCRICSVKSASSLLSQYSNLPLHLSLSLPFHQFMPFLSRFP